MNRTDAAPYISYAVDNALCERNPHDVPAESRLVGWQCGFEPLFVAVWSYWGAYDVLSDEEAIELATDLLDEKGWFGSAGPMEPDYVL